MAFAANCGIGCAKFAAWVFTGSASMLAEAFHSMADSANQALLLLGRRRGRKDANDRHPFGYGRERYFWAFVVAMVLFGAGALFALVEGEQRLRRPHELTSTRWAVGVLVFAFCLEGFSLRTAVRESNKRRVSGESWLGFVRRTRVPELAVVLLEDTGALIGLALALFGTIAADAADNPRFDAVGSVGIGILLAVIAYTLATEMKSLLIGEAAQASDVNAIRAALEDETDVVGIQELRTEQLGPEDILVVGTLLVSTTSASQLDAVRTRAEAAAREAVPTAQFVYLRAEPVSPLMKGRLPRGKLG